MTKNFIRSVLISSLVAGFAFMGCFNSSDDPSSGSGVPAAENVTLAQLQTITPTGSGTLPSDKTGTMQAVGDIGDIEDNAGEIVEDEFNPSTGKIRTSLKKNLANAKKNLKRNTASAIKKKIGSKATDGDSGSWNEKGTIDLAPFPSFDSGTVDYDSSGSYSWSESEQTNQAQGLVTFTSQDNSQENLKLKYKDVKPTRATGVIILNGFLNENSQENYNDSGTFDYIQEVLKSLSMAFNFSISHRSGFAISGDVYTGYLIMSFDLTASLNKAFTEAELAEINPDDDEAFEDLIENNISVSGSATVTLYNAAGAVVHTETLTAEEIFNMD